MSNDVRVEVDLDSKKAEQDAEGLKGKLGKVFGDMGKIAGGIFMAEIGGQITSKGVDTLKSSIGLARDYNEILSKSNTIFGEQAGAIEKWASGAATGFGQSKAEALDAASAFGNMFTQLGMGGETAAKMSTTMTELASDFASFHNADITEVINAQQAAFRGEYDALQKFVPTINAASVAQEALAQTGKKSTAELTAGEKAAAAYSLMIKGAGDATGDFARTSDGLANQQRIMGAQWKDIQASLGQALIPALTALAIAINTQVIPAVTKFAQDFQRYYDSDIKPAIENIVAGWQKIDQVIVPIIAMMLNDFKRMAEGFALAVGLILALISGDWSGAWEKAKGIVRLAVDSLKEKFDLIASSLQSIMQPVGEALGGIGKVISANVDAFIGFFNKIGPAFGDAWDAAKTAVTAPINAILGKIQAVIDLAKTALDWLNKVPGVSLGGGGSMANTASGFAQGYEGLSGGGGGGGGGGGSEWMSSYIGGGRYENLNLNPNVGEKGPGGLTWNGTSWMQRGSEGYTGNLKPSSSGGAQIIQVVLDGKVLAEAMTNELARAM